MSDEAFRKYEIGGAYHWKWYLLNYDGYREFTDRIAGLLPGDGRVLDIGCGDGLMSYIMFRRGLATVGIDDNLLAIEIAEKVAPMAINGVLGELFAEDALGHEEDDQLSQRFHDGQLRYRHQSGYDLNETAGYDHALCVEVIKHVEFPEKLIDRVLDSIREFAIITTPDGSGEEPGPYDHQIWTPDEFGEFLSGHRFEFLDLRPKTISVKLYKD